MKPTREEIIAAADEGNLALLRELVQRGADLNEVEAGGDSLFDDILTELCVEEKPYRYAVARTLLELGADPNVLGEDRSSPMYTPMFRMDTEMLRILLEAGADPNKPAGFVGTESFYDWAEFDYRYEVYEFKLPDEPTADAKKDEDAWLAFLDRMAVRHNRRRPDHLFLLRSHGAKSITEMEGPHQNGESVR